MRARKNGGQHGKRREVHLSPPSGGTPPAERKIPATKMRPAVKRRYEKLQADPLYGKLLDLFFGALGQGVMDATRYNAISTHFRIGKSEARAILRMLEREGLLVMNGRRNQENIQLTEEMKRLVGRTA